MSHKIISILRRLKRLIMGQHRKGCLSKAEYQQCLDMTLREWLIFHQKNLVADKCHWMGVTAWKNPLDAWVYQEIIYETKPDIIIEIGSAYGGSTLYFANLLDLIGKGMVISVDFDRSNYNVKHDRIITITGDSSSTDVLGKVSDLCDGKTVLVVHDGNHDKEQALRDLDAYSKFVSVNSYLIIEDGIVDILDFGEEHWQIIDGPLAATEEFMKDNTEFVVDTKRERYILTYNPKGYLKRVK